MVNRMLLPYTAEEIEIQLIDLFLEHGYSRSVIELISCWEHIYFTNKIDNETNPSKLRMQLLLRPGLYNIGDILNREGFEYAKARRVLLLKSKE